MQILMLSLDSSILELNSASFSRMKDYGSICDELRILVLAGREGGWVEISENVFAKSLGNSRIKSLLAALREGGEILARGGRWIITSQDPFETGFIAWRLSKKYKAPFEIQMHGDFYGNRYWKKERLLNRFRFCLGKFILKRAGTIRVVSERIEKTLKNLTKAKIFKNPICFEPLKDERNFLERREKGTPELLAVGNLVDVKNYGMLIDVFGELKKGDLKSAELFIAGDGYQMNDLKIKVENLGIENEVLIGAKRDLKAYYEEANIFVHPSLYEGWGRVIIEAASFGLPIVMSDVGLAGEVIKNEESGLVVPVSDKEALKNAILRLAKDEALRKKLGEGAKKAVANLPDKKEYLEKIKAAWEACYEISPRK